jgi:beta-lactamase class D
VEPQSAEELRKLFKQTVVSGTSRKSFRQIVRGPKYDEVEFGGKTGSLTGADPQGKCDWFVGYARYRDQRIAVAALTVNEKKWRVKSSMLANLYFQRYLKEIKMEDHVASNSR